MKDIAVACVQKVSVSFASQRKYVCAQARLQLQAQIY